MRYRVLKQPAQKKTIDLHANCPIIPKPSNFSGMFWGIISLLNDPMLQGGPTGGWLVAISTELRNSAASTNRPCSTKSCACCAKCCAYARNRLGCWEQSLREKVKQKHIEVKKRATTYWRYLALPFWDEGFSLRQCIMILVSEEFWAILEGFALWELPKIGNHHLGQNWLNTHILLGVHSLIANCGQEPGKKTFPFLPSSKQKLPSEQSMLSKLMFLPSAYQQSWLATQQHLQYIHLLGLYCFNAA